MKQLTCEMCGGADLVKQDGLYVCQNCGIKYTLEEARKLMSDEIVKIEGTVKIDDSEELKKLYMAARMAKETNNAALGAKYYQDILVKDPSSWEANFYTVYFQSLNSRLIDLNGAIFSMMSCKESVFRLIADLTNKTEQRNALKEVVKRYCEIADIFFEGIKTKNSVPSFFAGAVRSVPYENGAMFFSELETILQMLLEVADACRGFSSVNGAGVCGRKGVEICDKIKICHEREREKYRLYRDRISRKKDQFSRLI